MFYQNPPLICHSSVSSAHHDYHRLRATMASCLVITLGVGEALLTQSMVEKVQVLGSFQLDSRLFPKTHSRRPPSTRIARQIAPIESPCQGRGSESISIWYSVSYPPSA